MAPGGGGRALGAAMGGPPRSGPPPPLPGIPKPPGKSMRPGPHPRAPPGIRGGIILPGILSIRPPELGPDPDPGPCCAARWDSARLRCGGRAGGPPGPKEGGCAGGEDPQNKAGQKEKIRAVRCKDLSSHFRVRIGKGRSGGGQWEQKREGNVEKSRVARMRKAEEKDLERKRSTINRVGRTKSRGSRMRTWKKRKRSR